MSNEYSQGDLVRVSATFKVGVTPTDPTLTTFKLKEPGGKITTYVYGVDAGLVRDGAGYFHVDVIPSAAGEHFYYFAGSGDCQAVEESSFFVKRGEF